MHANDIRARTKSNGYTPVTAYTFTRTNVTSHNLCSTKEWKGKNPRRGIQSTALARQRLHTSTSTDRSVTFRPLHIGRVYVCISRRRHMSTPKSAQHQFKVRGVGPDVTYSDACLLARSLAQRTTYHPSTHPRIRLARRPRMHASQSALNVMHPPSASHHRAST